MCIRRLQEQLCRKAATFLCTEMNFRQIQFSETQKATIRQEKGRGVENPGGKEVSWALYRRVVSPAQPTSVTMTPNNKAVKR